MLKGNNSQKFFLRILRRGCFITVVHIDNVKKIAPIMENRKIQNKIQIDSQIPTLKISLFVDFIYAHIMF